MEARGGRHHHGHGHNRHTNGGGFSHNKRGHRGGAGGGGGGGRAHHGHGHHGHGGGGYGHHQGHGHGTGSRGSFWFKGEGYNDFEAVVVEEDVVGIRGFLTPDQPGFKGLVKQRYSDFVVHEIAANGQPVELTTLVAKKRSIQANFMEIVSAFVLGETTESTASSSSSPPDAPAVDYIKLIRHLAKSVAQSAAAQSKLGQAALEIYNHRRLVELVTRELGAKMGGEFAAFLDKAWTRKQAQAEARAAGISAENTVESSDLQFYVAGLHEKTDRVFIHETMRRFGKNLIVADTMTLPDQSQVIRVRPAFVGLSRKGDRDPRRDWPVDTPDFLQFVIYKRNKEIVAVVNQIAAVLKVNPSLFTYAEAKDKRGITTQLCTAFRVAKERFQTFVRLSGRNLDDQNYLVGNLKYVTKKLSLGDCEGNAFSMVLRGIPDEKDLTEQTLDKTVTTWRSCGFINFFGIQRFGSSATPHHILGRAMLRKDFKLAVLLLLRPQEGEASKIRQAREHFRQHKDVAAALRMLPPFLIPERAVLEGLLQHGLDANELAFRNIPVHLRLAYVEAYQYYVWNQMASVRVEKFSCTNAVVGDLVFADEESPMDLDADVPRRRVIEVTADTVGDYTISDVVLPLPGFQVTYPSNEIGVAYQKLLAMDGVDFPSWASVTHSVNHHPYDLKGSYRFVVTKPKDVRFEALAYTDSMQPLLLNDVDKLQGRKSPLDQRLVAPSGSEKKATFATTDAAADVAGFEAERADHEKKSTPGRALVLHFRLDYGSDATVAVRELLKQSSSMHTQQQLNEAKDGVVHRSQVQANAGAASAIGNGMAGDLTGKKRPSTTTLSGNVSKESKGAAQKKTQVAIGRPGFSLGKGH